MPKFLLDDSAKLQRRSQSKQKQQQLSGSRPPLIRGCLLRSVRRLARVEQFLATNVRYYSVVAYSRRSRSTQQHCSFEQEFSCSYYYREISNTKLVLPSIFSRRETLLLATTVPGSFFVLLPPSLSRLHSIIFSLRRYTNTSSSSSCVSQ
jgi:hypothetical protein